VEEARELTLTQHPSVRALAQGSADVEEARELTLTQHPSVRAPAQGSADVEEARELTLTPTSVCSRPCTRVRRRGGGS